MISTVDNGMRRLDLGCVPAVEIQTDDVDHPDEGMGAHQLDGGHSDQIGPKEGIAGPREGSAGRYSLRRKVKPPQRLLKLGASFK